MGFGESVLARWNNNWPDISSSNRREGYERVEKAIEPIVGACPRTIQIRIGFSFFEHGAGAWATIFDYLAELSQATASGEYSSCLSLLVAWLSTFTDDIKLFKFLCCLFSRIIINQIM